MSSIALRAVTLVVLVFLPTASALADTLTAELVGQVFVSGLSADGKVAVGQTSDYDETFRWQSAGWFKRPGRGTLDVLSITSASPAVSADGKTFAVAEQLAVAPLTKRTRLIHRGP